MANREKASLGSVAVVLGVGGAAGLAGAGLGYIVGKGEGLPPNVLETLKNIQPSQIQPVVDDLGTILRPIKPQTNAPKTEAAAPKEQANAVTQLFLNELQTWHSQGADLGHAVASEQNWNEKPVMDWFKQEVFSQLGAHKVDYKISYIGNTRRLSFTFYDQTVNMDLDPNQANVDIVAMLDKAEVTRTDDKGVTETRTIGDWIRNWTKSKDLTAVAIGNSESTPEGSGINNLPYLPKKNLGRAAIITAAGRDMNAAGEQNLGTAVIMADSLPFDLFKGKTVQGETPLTTDGALVMVPGKVDINQIRYAVQQLGVSGNNQITTEASNINDAGKTLYDFSTLNAFVNGDPNRYPDAVAQLEQTNPDSEVQYDGANTNHQINVPQGDVLVITTTGELTGSNVQLLNKRQADGRNTYAIRGSANLFGTGGGILMRDTVK
ncbi:hypothetical protein M1523_01345 [Patescibacteria group bacterium]|nr:hypothetical protein [Patescibacteria group bacterium]MCL5091961.1 hypothetical protein [Patescibacteria group bacterium]